MSKVGVSVRSENVEAVTEVKRKRKRVEIVKITVDGVEVGAKECTRCGKVKLLDDFYADKRSESGRTSHCKNCKRSEGREYYVGNRSKILDYQRRYSTDNREKIRKRQRVWNESNREIVSNYKRKWYENNRLQALKNARKWCKSNPEKRREVCRKWNTKNPDAGKAHVHRRLAMKRALPLNWTTILSKEVQREFSNICALTGSTLKIHMDHFIPLSWGHGGSYFGNMVPLTEERIAPTIRTQLTIS
ncbi:hypothetical protein KM924_23405 [Brevibacillus parabrevis]|uniref:hypothetical protein n=1 Tax=Brevibacillus parabrevis TaxID=54914 RepID=UPI001C2338D6|nr:hypothetical protein [Brevibacillus parabrevis]MBU8715451.1 hypothetical protein [Brevibacillus parabrevis]